MKKKKKRIEIMIIKQCQWHWQNICLHIFPDIGGQTNHGLMNTQSNVNYILTNMWLTKYN